MTVLVSDDLGTAVEKIVEEQPEMTESRFVREALRRELQRYEQADYGE